MCQCKCLLLDSYVGARGGNVFRCAFPFVEEWGGGGKSTSFPGPIWAGPAYFLGGDGVGYLHQAIPSWERKG